MRDYYEILMVHERAIPEVIDRVYRLLARRHHPDIHPPEKRPQAERRMLELNVAYQVLSDPEQRAEYDQQRRMGRPPPTGGVRVDDGGSVEALLKCFNHPQRPSVAFCWECGRPICESCVSPSDAGPLFGSAKDTGHRVCNTCVRRNMDLEARINAGRRADPEGPFYRRPMGGAGVVVYYFFVALILGALSVVVFRVAQLTDASHGQAANIAVVVAVLYVALIVLRLAKRVRCPNCRASCGRVDFRRVAPWLDFLRPHPVCHNCGRHYRKQEVGDPLD